MQLALAACYDLSSYEFFFKSSALLVLFQGVSCFDRVSPAYSPWANSPEKARVEKRFAENALFNYREKESSEVFVIEIHPLVYPIFSLLAGIVILIFPAILNYVVAFYLIIIGILGIFKH